MIINTGMRTDIPAFYSEWLMNRIREGFVMVRNPYFGSSVNKYNLSPEVVDCLAFCTKNPHPMLKYIDELKEKYNMFWFVTITPYGKDLEPNVPDKKQVIEDFKILSDKLGKNTVALRYDPILLTQKINIDYHIKAFEILLERLDGYTEDVTISFVDMYEKVYKNAPNVKAPTNDEQEKIAEAFAKIGAKHNMVIHGCCENPNLSKFGLDMTGCMSQEIVEKAIGHKLKPKGQKSKRIMTDTNKKVMGNIVMTEKGKAICNCLMGNDIGAYNSCMHLCKYCYANFNKTLVEKNYALHDPKSPFIIGTFKNGDKIIESKQKSWVVE